MEALILLIFCTISSYTLVSIQRGSQAFHNKALAKIELAITWWATILLSK